jgi:DNA-binding CsgD family transcriptional regulator
MCSPDMSENDPAALRQIDSQVRTLVFQRFIADGRAPNIPAIAKPLGLSVDEAVASLRRLEHPGDLLLAPRSNQLWIARPFASPGSGYVVISGGQRYWAACAQDALWTSLVLAADVRIDTQCADCAEPLCVEVQGGCAIGNAVIHVCVPPSHFFDNITFTCGTTLFFRSESHARRWCAERGLPFGSIVSLSQMLEISRVGHRTHIDSSYGLSDEPIDKRIGRFVDAGLTSEFWLTRRQDDHDPTLTRESIADESHGRGPAHLERYHLTGREREVLHLLAGGSSLKQVAYQLGVSPYTADTHVRNIYSKLAVRSRAAAIAIALRARLI